MVTSLRIAVISIHGEGTLSLQLDWLHISTTPLTQRTPIVCDVPLILTRTRSPSPQLTVLPPQDDSDDDLRKPAPRKRPAAARSGAAKPAARGPDGKLQKKHIRKREVRALWSTISRSAQRRDG